MKTLVGFALTLLASIQPSLAEDSTVPVEPASSSPWTFLVYGAVDNDWEGPFMRDIRGMRRSLSGAEDVEVVLLVDRSPKHSKNESALGEDFDDTRLYRLTGGNAARIDGTPELSDVTTDSETEKNMGDPATLKEFIRFGKRRFPAKHYALFLVSHGEGPRSCPDETDGGDELFTAEFSDGLGEEESVDLIVFDACLMAAAENAYQWRRAEGQFGADYFVAAAPVSSSLPYADIFSRLQPADPSSESSGDDLPRPALAPETLAPRDLAAMLVEELGHQIREGRSGDEGLERDLQSWGAFDLSKVSKAKNLLDELASRLFEEGEKEDLLALRGKGLEAETFVYVWPERNADLNMPHVDLCHLCERIASSELFTDDTRRLAARAADAAAEVIIRSVGFDHYEGFTPARHGLYLVFPDGDAKTRRGKSYWQRTSWYSPLPVEGRKAFGRYAWCADGATPDNGEVENWFELMDAWFDAQDDNGGSNGYRH